MMPRPKNNTY